MNSLVIFGSARSEGNTKKALEAVLGERNVEVVNLLDKQVAYYSYERTQEDDDFLDIAVRAVDIAQGNQRFDALLSRLADADEDTAGHRHFRAACRFERGDPQRRHLVR